MGMSNTAHAAASHAPPATDGLKPHQYDVLVASVNIARERGIRSLRLLSAALSEQGHADEDIAAALSTWSQYEAGKRQEVRAAT